MPLPDNPADLDPMMWAQIKDRMREAADEIDLLRDLQEARKALLPISRDHAEKMVLIGEAFLASNPRE